MKKPCMNERMKGSLKKERKTMSRRTGIISAKEYLYEEQRRQENELGFSGKNMKTEQKTKMKIMKKKCNEKVSSCKIAENERR